MKANYLQFLLFSCISLLSIQCAKESTKNREHLIFRYNESDNITSLDPAYASKKENIWALNQLFNSLVQLDDNLNIQPDIAKSWEISDDLTTYTFNLRKDIKFHKHPEFKTPDSTRTVTAHDVEYSLNRLLDPKIASPGRWVFDKVDNFKAINDTLFKIQLKQAFPAYLGLLSTRYCSIVPKEIVEFYGNDFRKHPVGTGPFAFKAWEENTKLVFRKNPLYYETDENGEQLPYLEAIAITFLPDKQSEFLQFVRGELDYLNDIESSYKDELLTPLGELQDKYKETINLTKTSYLNSEYIGIYLDKKSPLQNKNMRKAINYGFDRKNMITYLRNGIGTPATSGFIPSGIDGYNRQEGFSYQPEKAKAYLKKYIEETGDQKPIIHLATNANYLNFCEFIQREVAKVGITLMIDVLPAPTLRQQKHAGKLELFRASWIADYPDAENFMLPYYGPNFTPNGPNYTHFKNSTFDRLYEESFNVSNIEERKLIYQQMDSIIIAEAPIIPLFYDQVIRFTPKNISGLSKNAQNFLFLKRVKKGK